MPIRIHSSPLVLAFAWPVALVSPPCDAETQFMLGVNPAHAQDGSGLGPDGIIEFQDAPGFVFGASSVSVGLKFYFDEQPDDLYTVENFAVTTTPALTSYQLGLGDLGCCSYQPLFDAYFAVHPEAAYAWAWLTWGDNPIGSNFVTSGGWSGDPTPVNLLPLDTCGASVAFTMFANLSPYTGDGVLGFKVSGIKTSHKLCFYVDYTPGAPTGQNGHAWVEFLPQDGSPVFVGKYPTTGDVWNGPAVISDQDASHPWAYKVCYRVSSSDYSNAVAYAIQQIDAAAAGTTTYNAIFDNCVHFTNLVAGAAGIELLVPDPLGAGIAYPSRSLYLPLKTAFESGASNGCSKVFASTGDAGAPDGRDRLPFDFDAGGIAMAALDDIAAAADAAHLQSLVFNPPPALLHEGESLVLGMVGFDPSSAMVAVDWGDGTTIDVPTVLLAHQYAVGGAYPVRVVWYDSGSIQRFDFDAFVFGGAAVGKQVVVLAPAVVPPSTFANTAVLASEGPADLPPFSCAKDCNGNGVPDCEEYSPFDGSALALVNPKFALVPNAPALQAPSGASLTIEAWLRFESLPSSFGVIVSKGIDATTNYELRVRSDGGVDFVYKNAAAPGWSILATDGGLVPAGRWVHVAIGTVFGVDGPATIYVDGLARPASWIDPPTGAPSVSGEGLRIGAVPLAAGQSPTWFLDGIIDDVRLWNVLRTPAQIVEDMTTAARPSANGLVAWWRFDEGQGTTAADAAPFGGSNNALVAAGASWVPTVAASACPRTCVGDLNRDRHVDGADLGMLLGDWGAAGTPSDLTGDGAVDGADLGVMLSAWGDCP
ncbi:MAG: LamG-like jellyroll fold domain-containing protein [Phycisphaerales bacterium]